jgi:hypothetical protein
VANSVCFAKGLPVGVVVIDTGDKALPPALVLPGSATHAAGAAPTAATHAAPTVATTTMSR